MKASDFRQCVRCLAVVSSSTLAAYGHKCGQDLWQPIKTAPKDTDVLVYTESGMTVARFLGDGSWSLAQYGSYAEDGMLDSPPTHWMPLPEAPNKTDTQLTP